MKMKERNEVKQAVKEALDDKWREDTTRQISDLATQVTAGFTAVHTRQDVTNGKVMAHQARFDKMDGEKKGAAGYEKFLWIIITTLISLVVYFLR